VESEICIIALYADQQLRRSESMFTFDIKWKNKDLKDGTRTPEEELDRT